MLETILIGVFAVAAIVVVVLFVGLLILGAGFNRG